MPVLEEFSLKGKTAILASDESSGEAALTPDLAGVLAEAGATVRVLARSRDALDAAVVGRDRISGALCDATREADVEAAVSRVIQEWGRVDVLVNNFQTRFAGPFQEVGVSEFQAVMDRNVKPVFLMCREVGRAMLQGGGGRIVNITSGMAERGLWNSAAYCASQGAVLQLTRSLALEWGRSNIRVNAIGTGWFSDQETSAEDAQKELLVRYIPLRRKGHPRDIGPLLVYLASDACDYTTGQPVYVDGGLMAHP